MTKQEPIFYQYGNSRGDTKYIDAEFWFKLFPNKDPDKFYNNPPKASMILKNALTRLPKDGVNVRTYPHQIYLCEWNFMGSFARDCGYRILKTASKNGQCRIECDILSDNIWNLREPRRPHCTSVIKALESLFDEAKPGMDYIPIPRNFHTNYVNIAPKYKDKAWCDIPKNKITPMKPSRILKNLSVNDTSVQFFMFNQERDFVGKPFCYRWEIQLKSPHRNKGSEIVSDAQKTANLIDRLVPRIKGEMFKPYEGGADWIANF